MYLISEDNVLEYYSMNQCIEDVEKAFKLSKTSKVDIPFRTVLQHQSEGSHTLYMPSYVEDLAYASIKISSLFPENIKHNIPMIQSVMILTETKSGKHVATISASALTVLRTGAIGGLGAKYLSRPDSKTLGVVGCGAQSFGQVQAVIEVRDIKEIYLYNRTRQKAIDLQEKINQTYDERQLEIHIVEEANEAVKEADIIVSSTSSNTPVFSGHHIKPGTHVNAIGSCAPEKQEYDVELLKKAKKVVVDTYEGATQEAGGLINPVKNKEWSMDNIYGELADIILKEKDGRTSSEEITLLDSVGVGYLDTVCAASIYEIMSK